MKCFAVRSLDNSDFSLKAAQDRRRACLHLNIHGASQAVVLSDIRTAAE